MSAKAIKRRSRVSCSGRARSVLDHIDRTETEAVLSRRPARTITLPMTPYSWAVLQYPDPMTDEEWDRLMALLAVFRPGLVE